MNFHDLIENEDKDHALQNYTSSRDSEMYDNTEQKKVMRKKMLEDVRKKAMQILENERNEKLQKE
jgi:hypothetical protein